MKVLLVGEGASELGGALEALIRRLGLAEADIDHDEVKQAGIHLHYGRGQGFFKRAVRWTLEAQKRGYDALILVIDEDGRPETITEFAEAQGYAKATIHRAFGVAIHTFDAWMLADENALTKVLGYAVSRQQDPESVKQPKLICRELLANCAQSMRAREMYAAIARIIDIGVLQRRCRKGFAPFAERVQQL